MSYTLEEFKLRGIYEKKEDSSLDLELEGGRIISDLPQRIRLTLDSTGGDSYEGDYSRQDSAIITSLLSHGLSPRDTYSTFLASSRGKDAVRRKNGHVDDYISRTIKKAAAFLKIDTKIKVDFARRKQAREGEGIITQAAKSIEVERPHWVWPRYIPAGKITILAGDPGLGKSTIALDIISRISRGTFLPLSGRTIAGTCLIASAEDAAEDTIVPRLIASQANLDRVEIMREVRVDGETKYLSFPRDLNRLRDTIVKIGCRLAIIDPFNAFLSRETDSHRDQDVRLVLAPFESIAEETGAAIVIIAHLNKREEASTIYRVGGSIGLIGAARSVLAVTQLPSKATRVLFPIKSNLSKSPMALEYEVKGITKHRNGSGAWKGEGKIKSSTVHWVGEVLFDPKTQSTNTKTKADNSGEEFLRQLLSDCELSCEDIFKEARQAGLMRSQLIRAKDNLNIKTVRKNNEWWWKFGD